MAESFKNLKYTICDYDFISHIRRPDQSFENYIEEINQKTNNKLDHNFNEPSQSFLVNQSSLNLKQTNLDKTANEPNFYYEKTLQDNVLKYSNTSQYDTSYLNTSNSQVGQFNQNNVYNTIPLTTQTYNSDNLSITTKNNINSKIKNNLESEKLILNTQTTAGSLKEYYLAPNNLSYDRKELNSEKLGVMQVSASNLPVNSKNVKNETTFNNIQENDKSTDDAITELLMHRRLAKLKQQEQFGITTPNISTSQQLAKPALTSISSIEHPIGQSSMLSQPTPINLSVFPPSIENNSSMQFSQYMQLPYNIQVNQPPLQLNGNNNAFYQNQNGIQQNTMFYNHHQFSENIPQNNMNSETAYGNKQQANYVNAQQSFNASMHQLMNKNMQQLKYSNTQPLNNYDQVQQDMLQFNNANMLQVNARSFQPQNNSLPSEMPNPLKQQFNQKLMQLSNGVMQQPGMQTLSNSSRQNENNMSLQQLVSTSLQQSFSSMNNQSPSFNLANNVHPGTSEASKPKQNQLNLNISTETKMLAKFPYQQNEASPFGANGELSLKVMEEVLFLEHHPEANGWSLVQNKDGKCGFVPFNYLTIANVSSGLPWLQNKMAETDLSTISTKVLKPYISAYDKSGGTKQTYQCEVCNRSFNGPQPLAAHMASKAHKEEVEIQESYKNL